MKTARRTMLLRTEAKAALEDAPVDHDLDATAGAFAMALQVAAHAGTP